MPEDKDKTYAVVGVGALGAGARRYEIVERTSGGERVLAEVEGTGDSAEDVRRIRAELERLMEARDEGRLDEGAPA